jgi:hypothetical protein
MAHAEAVQMAAAASRETDGSSAGAGLTEVGTTDWQKVVDGLVHVLRTITLDGYSMSSILFEKHQSTRQSTNLLPSRHALQNGSPSVHAPPRNDSMVYYPQFAQQSRGLYAARSGRYKAHFATQGSLQCGENNTDPVCKPSSGYTKQLPPLLYNLNLDASEQWPLDPASDEYKHGLADVVRVVDAHLRGMVWYAEPMLNYGG